MGSSLSSRSHQIAAASVSLCRYILRIPAALYFLLSIAKPVEKEGAGLEWGINQTQIVLIFFFSWCNSGFILTGVVIMVRMARA